MPALITEHPQDPGPRSQQRPDPGSPDVFLRARIAERRRRSERRRFAIVAACVVAAVVAAAWAEDATSTDPAPSTPAPSSADSPLRGLSEPSQESLSPEAAGELMRQPDPNSSDGVQRPAIAPPDAASSDDPTASGSTPETAPIEQPTRIEIPAIAVDAELVGVGLNPDRSMEVPDFGLAGWYTKGPRPGASGPAVIAAHVDSYQGPDVFFRLHELEPGDEIRVHGADGRTRTWRMYHSQLVDKDRLPADRIWSETDQPALRLITCGGEFDYTERSYESNVIVYATPVDR